MQPPSFKTISYIRSLITGPLGWAQRAFTSVSVVTSSLSEHHSLTDQHDYLDGARWSSGIDAAIGARGHGLRPVYYLTVQRPWTSR